MEELITVFTPTYNRAGILHRCYESLCNQSVFNFKWLIVDDGSTDSTSELVQSWVSSETRFSIDYIFQENGGLHTAYNTAVEKADCELFVCFESDDIFESNAMEIIRERWKTFKQKGCVGFITLCRDMEGHLIGEKFPEDLDSTYYWEHRRIAEGDKQYIYRTDMLKKVFPMPVFKGEKFFDPKFRFFEIDKYGKLGVTNDVFDIVDYQSDGLTKTVLYHYYNSPNSFAEYRKLYMTLPCRSVSFLIKTNIHYVASCILAKKADRAVVESPRKIYTILCFLPGALWAGILKLLFSRK